jgi:molybdate transport system substrate-binding protein
MELNKKVIAVVATVLIVIVLVAASISLNAQTSLDKKELTVFAAASLNAAFTDIGKSYEANHSNVKVSFDFDGSANLKTQLIGGAIADVFASADQKNMDAVVKSGLIDSSAVTAFVKNRLVVIIPSSNPGNVQTVSDLARSGLKIVIGDASVPIGNYTRTALAEMSNEYAYGADYQSKVMANVVSQESSVNQIVAKVSLGEADAGIVYSTDAASAGASVSTLTISDQYNVIAVYPIAPLLGSKTSVEARGFVDYVLSPAGQSILARYGFITVEA